MLLRKKFSAYALLLGIAFQPCFGFFGFHDLFARITSRLPLIKLIARDIVGTYKKPYKKHIALDVDNTIAPEALAQQLTDALTKKSANQQSFLLGASTSEHQCSKKCHELGEQLGKPICSWDRFAAGKGLAQPSDSQFTIDLWNNYKDYIDHTKEKLGLNALRFSIEWALVQPDGHDAFDQVSLDHYANQFVYAIKKGITPIICFHHYTDPCWFADKGGFEKQENTQYFVNFCNKVYIHLTQKLHNTITAEDTDVLELLQNRPPLWATFNSPEGYAFKGYNSLENPTSENTGFNQGTVTKKGLNWTERVLGTMMDAHVKVYKQLKSSYNELPINKEYINTPQIGFLKNITQLDPAHKKWWHVFMRPVSRLCCSVGELLQSDCIYKFFKTGHFASPLHPNIRITNLDAPQALDFIGLNYYSNQLLLGKKRIAAGDNDPDKTDNANYRMYPAGLLRAIAELHDQLVKPLQKKTKKQIPIFVTENGIATTDNNKRNTFYRCYMQALVKAIQNQKYDVRGYLTWTLADNYEWPKVQDSESIQPQDRRIYGLCTINQNGQLAAKEGAAFYLNFARAVLEHTTNGNN